MNERALQILEQYDIKLLRSFGGRGAVMLETEQGLKLLKEFTGSRSRLPYEQRLLACLEAEGVCRTDRAVANREGAYISVGEYETPYLLKNWPPGKECDTRNKEELLRSMRMLARIHRTARGIWQAEEAEKPRLTGQDRRAELEKHNRELKRVRNFMRSKRKKGDFELMFLKYADGFMEKGQQAFSRLCGSPYGELYEGALAGEHICHGEYIHHNILMSRQETAVVNFERCEINVQLHDICLFLRKIMEKQSWDVNLAGRMLEAYEKELPLTGEELSCLVICLSYPEKVWKLAHHYYHTNKAWIPEKSTEKLEVFLAQEEEKTKMLQNLL